MYDHEAHFEKEYRGFRLYGWARSVDNYSPSWFAVSDVYVQRRRQFALTASVVSRTRLSLTKTRSLPQCSVFFSARSPSITSPRR
jgi:hypothetical protein